MTVQDFFYKGDVRIISIPKRELSPASIYPELIGRIGRVIRMSGNKVGIMIDNKYNNWSQYGCFWFDPECLGYQAGILGHSMTEMKAFFTSGFNTLKIRSMVLRLHFEYLQKKSIIAM